ncbi:MAG: 16S rRNA (guanine(966)-N(2))-methyltransferase RsmD [Mariprofundaceae bacterium]
MAGGVRITSGSLRGRLLPIPQIRGLRPTPAKVRQAMFNIIGPVNGVRVLDLFAGSGLMALEAISRGAAHVTSIDRHRRATGHLLQVRDQWHVSEHWKIITGEAHAILGRMAGERFDIVFADPPYEQGFSEKIPAWLDEFGIGCSSLVIEESARVNPDWPEGWTVAPPRRYGDTCLHFLERGGEI